MKLARGDIILCKIPMPSKNLIEFKLRPCVIVSNDLNNKRLDDVIVAICTSNISRQKEETQLLIDGEEIKTTGIRIPSVIKCEFLITINKSMIVRVIGNLSKEKLNELNKCLKISINV